MMIDEQAGHTCIGYPEMVMMQQCSNGSAARPGTRGCSLAFATPRLRPPILLLLQECRVQLVKGLLHR